MSCVIRKYSLFASPLSCSSIITSGYGPWCSLNKCQTYTFHLFILPTSTMSDFVSKLHVEKLNTDGSNWVSFHDRMMWVLRSRGLLEHLTSTVVTANYTAIGTVNNITPQMKWDNDEATTMHVIAASIPNSVFTNVKSKPNTKEV